MIDVVAKLNETELGIRTLRAAGLAVPEEAVELQETMSRCVRAESRVALLVDSRMTLGSEAYRAYCAHSGNKSLVSGADLPPWEEVIQPIKEAWDSAANSVARRILGGLGLME